MAAIDSFLVKKGDSLVALAPIDILIPKRNFDVNLASEVDETIQTFGTFAIRSGDGKRNFNVKFPLKLSLNVFDRTSDTENIILHYKANDIVIDRMTYFKGPKPANAFLDLFTSGKFVGLTQEELVKLLNDNVRLNGASTGMNSELAEVMISELVRYKKDPSIPYRMVSNKVPETPENAIFMPIKEVARTSSVFAALAFEDVKKAVQASVFMTRTDQEQVVSPIEKAVLQTRIEGNE